MVFGDDKAIHQLATVTGSVAKGYVANLTVRGLTLQVSIGRPARAVSVGPAVRWTVWRGRACFRVRACSQEAFAMTEY